MTEPARLNEVWASRDYPVLVTTARMLEDDDLIQAHTIAQECGLPHRDVVRALTNLGHRHLDVRDSSTYGGRDNYVVGICPAGLEAVGQWPTPEDAADRLLAALDTLVANAPEDSPKQSVLRRVRDGLAAGGRDVVVDVAAAIISGRLPM